MSYTEIYLAIQKTRVIHQAATTIAMATMATRPSFPAIPDDIHPHTHPPEPPTSALHLLQQTAAQSEPNWLKTLSDPHQHHHVATIATATEYIPALRQSNQHSTTMPEQYHDLPFSNTSQRKRQQERWKAAFIQAQQQYQQATMAETPSFLASIPVEILPKPSPPQPPTYT